MTHVADHRRRLALACGGGRLLVLAAEIKNAHAEAGRAVQMTVVHAIKAGDALIEAKALLKHGEWLPWLRDNCQMPERTAQLYMQIASNKGELGKKRNVADLSLRSAVLLLNDACKKAKTTDELERDARVKRYIEKRQAKADKHQLEKNDHQVKDFQNAIKAFEAAVAVAAKSVSKFAPEGVAFTIRRLDMVAAAIQTAKENLEPKQYAARPLPKPRPGKPVVGLEAARRHYLDLCADLGVNLDEEQGIIFDALREIAGKRAMQAQADDDPACLDRRGQP